MKKHFLILTLSALVLLPSCGDKPGQENSGITFEDTIVLSSQEEVDAFATKTKLAALTGEVRLGDLTIEGEAVTDISAIQFTEVDVLTIKGTSIEHLSNTFIEKIGRLLEIDSNPLLKLIDVFTLVNCQGDIFITDNAVLEDISFLFYLETMAGKLVITGNPCLGEDRPNGGIAWGFNVIKYIVDSNVMNREHVVLRNNHPDAATKVEDIGKVHEDDPPIGPAEPDGRNYKIENGIITEEVLNNYLDKAITESEYLNSASYNSDGYYGKEDDTRMLLNVGAKFIGRAMYTWGREARFTKDAWFDQAKAKIEAIHAVDPDVIFQAALFEIVTPQVNQVPIPDWCFRAFGLEPEQRNFSFDRIRNPGGKYLGQWGNDTAVPDMTQLECQMWFYFMAVKYMDCGIEAFHCGQINLMASMGDAAAGYPAYKKLFTMMREYARTHTRHGIVLLDAHCNGHVVDGVHLLDFASYPIRLCEVSGSSKMEALIKKKYLDSIIGGTKAGKTPSGWYTDRIPYMVEFDNFGTSGHPGSAADDIFCWGYDEISWIGNVSTEVARDFLRYGYDWFKEWDKMGHLEMPGMRVAAGADKSKNPYANNPFRCNTRSASCPLGADLESTIKEIWAGNGQTN
ncbi:MAG: hypothetical protein MJY56_00570 [Bacteroidales bacterium]|nr:hypothetical protein [Bacteroidales bacterium]